jgi:signal transduction histidine kinase
MIDITGNILHNQQKTQNEFLQLINACVSHDLRNPLNSIKAMNIEKKYFYKLMDEALSNEEISLPDLIKNLKTTLKQLKQNLKT